MNNIKLLGCDMSKIIYLLIFTVVFLSLNAVVAFEDNSIDLKNLSSQPMDSITVDDWNSEDLNSTADDNDIVAVDSDDGKKLFFNENEGILSNNSFQDENNGAKIIKDKSSLSIKSKNIKSVDNLVIYLKDSNNNPIKNQKLIAKINKKSYNIKTNNKGAAILETKLPEKNYKLTVSYTGDENYNKISQVFKIKVSKLNTKLKSKSTFIIRGHYLIVNLYDQRGNPISGKKVFIKIKGKTYKKTTNKNGKVSLKMKLQPNYYKSSIKFNTDGYYMGSVKKLNFYLLKRSSLEIGNDNILTNGFLRIYFKDLPRNLLCKKTVKITVGKKKFSRKTDAEGIILFKPKVGTKKYTVTANFKNLTVTKKVKGIRANTIDPMKNSVPWKKGSPNIDYLPGNYVKGDPNAVYTLKKAQYLEVLKRDSECLYRYKKLSIHVFFKTKQNPIKNHIVKREKWNVIEKDLNKRIVSANYYNYLPKEITVSLKGKSYVYPEVRDPQNTEYTCGPTSASVCSQVLKNYRSERYFADLAGTNQYGTSSSAIAYALQKNGFSCSYFYRTSYDYGINELKKGACALIFHTKNHYVAVIDISKDGKNVLVSNSYGDWYNIPTNWISVKYLKTRFYKNYDDSLVVKLNYHLSKSTKTYLRYYYYNMGCDWDKCNVHETI